MVGVGVQQDAVVERRPYPSDIDEDTYHFRWGQFLNLLSLKAADAGRRVIGVDPRFTSQLCHTCGHTEKANRRTQAVFVCVQCGHQANADHNAALNILGRAVPSGVNVEQLAHALSEKPRALALR